MAITGIVAQLRTTDMASSIRFYTEKLGVLRRVQLPGLLHRHPSREPDLSLEAGG
jgi:hypothetical protein